MGVSRYGGEERRSFLPSPGFPGYIPEIVAPGAMAVGSFSAEGTADAVGWRAASAAAIEGVGFDALAAGSLVALGIGVVAYLDYRGLEALRDQFSAPDQWSILRARMAEGSQFGNMVVCGGLPPPLYGSNTYDFGFYFPAPAPGCYVGANVSPPPPVPSATLQTQTTNGQAVVYARYRHPIGFPGIVWLDAVGWYSNPNYPAQSPSFAKTVTRTMSDMLQMPQPVLRQFSYQLAKAEPRLRPYEVPSRDFEYTPGRVGPTAGVPGVHQQRPPRKNEREKKRLLNAAILGLRVSMTAHQVLSCMVANTKSWRHYHHAGYAYSSFKNGSARGKSLEQMYQYVFDNIDNLDMAGFASCVAQRQAASIATSAMGSRLSPDLKRSTNGGWWVPKVHFQPPPSRGPEVVEGNRKRRSYRMR